MWDPFQLVTRSRYPIKYSVLGRRRGTFTGLIVRYSNVEDGVGGANRPGACACMGRAEGDKTTVTPVGITVHTLGCHFREVIPASCGTSTGYLQSREPID